MLTRGSGSKRRKASRRRKNSSFKGDIYRSAGVVVWCVVLVACSVGWFISLLVREEVLLAGLCERKILFRLEIYDRLRQATAKRTG